MTVHTFYEIEDKMTKEKEKEIDIEESFHTIDEIDADSVAIKDAEEPTKKSLAKNVTTREWASKNLNKIIFGASLLILAILIAVTFGLIAGRNKSNSNSANTPKVPRQSTNTTAFRLPEGNYDLINKESTKSEFLKECTKVFEKSPKKIECINAEEGSIIFEIESAYDTEELNEIVPEYLNKVEEINGQSTKDYQLYIVQDSWTMSIIFPNVQQQDLLEFENDLKEVICQLIHGDEETKNFIQIKFNTIGNDVNATFSIPYDETQIKTTSVLHKYAERLKFK
jgi:hypothetical protein